MGDINLDNFLDMSIRDMWTVIWNNKEWLFSGVGLIGFSFIVNTVKKLRFINKSIPEVVSKTKQKGLYNKNNLVDILQIESRIKKYFPEYSDYLFIQYGSSVDSKNSSPNDYDFIVLLLGHPENNVKHVHSRGNYPRNDLGIKATNVDLVFRDYLSFLFAACAGMPYENSVIVNSELLNGHRGYYQWLKNITMNIMIDRDFLIRRFYDKINSEKEVYINAKKYNSENKYDIVRAGYYYVTSLLQLKKIETFDKVIMQQDVVKLSKVIPLGCEYFKDKDIQDKYLELVNLLKRNESNYEEIDISFIDKLIDIAIKE